jgi:hypothetical protein
MGGVKYESGGAPVVRNFSDSLQTIVTTYGLGDSWLAGIPSPSSGNMDTLRSYFRNANGATFSAASVNQNNTFRFTFTPRAIVSTIRSNQYVQAEFNLNDSALAGIFVSGIFALGAVQNSAWRSYELGWGTTDNNPANMYWAVNRCVGATGTTILQDVPGSCVNGDVMGLSVEVASGQNNLRVWKNGALVGSVSDNNAARPTFGNPGLVNMVWISNAAPGNRNNRFRNFTCRVGTR